MTPEDIYEKPIEVVLDEVAQKVKENLKTNPPKIMSDIFTELRKSLITEQNDLVKKTYNVAINLYNFVKIGLHLADQTIIEPTTRTFKTSLSKNGNNCKFKLEFIIGNYGTAINSCFAIDVIYDVNDNTIRFIGKNNDYFNVDKFDQNAEQICDIVKNVLCDQITRAFQE
jgi:hypothetical protein